MNLLTVEEVAQILKSKPTTIYCWARRGMIPSVKVGGMLRFREEDIRQWLLMKVKEAAARIRQMPKQVTSKSSIKK